MKQSNQNDIFAFQDGSSYGSRRIARGPIMEIDNVRREDAGTYMCTATNNVGTMSADEIDLRVLCKFQIFCCTRLLNEAIESECQLVAM